MQYKILKDFKGSPDGCRTIQFVVGQIVTEGTDYSTDLAEVAIVEGWATKHIDEPPKKKAAKKKAKK
jgi:hypothetical protein